jgi:hypothetical protein
MYKIYNIHFKTKSDIISFCEELIENSMGNQFENHLLEFFKEIIAYHDHNYDVNHIISILPIFNPNDQHKYMGLLVNFKIPKKRGYKYEKQMISIKRCVKNIETIIDYENCYIPFGKYKGSKLIEINDDNYLNYLLGWSELSPYIRKCILKYIENRKLINQHEIR